MKSFLYLPFKNDFMAEIVLNHLAVVVAAVIHMALGMLWYSPALFGKAWIKLVGMTDKEMKEAKKKGMGKTMVVAFVASLVLMYVLAAFVDLVSSTTFALGAQTGAWAWLGFIATVMLNSVLWEKKPVKLYLINVSYYLVSLVVMGGLLAAWA